MRDPVLHSFKKAHDSNFARLEYNQASHWVRRLALGRSCTLGPHRQLCWRMFDTPAFTGLQRLIFSGLPVSNMTSSNTALAASLTKLRENVFMSADERYVRELWAKSQAWLKRCLPRKKSSPKHSQSMQPSPSRNENRSNGS